MGRSEQKARRRALAKENRCNPGAKDAREQEKQQVKQALEQRREERAEREWGDRSSMEHHCPVCQAPLLKPNAKRTCVEKGHVAPCARYHEVIMRPNDHTCTACRQERTLHDKRHKEIFELFHAARNLIANADHALLNPQPPGRITHIVPRFARNGGKKGPNPIRTRQEEENRARREKNARLTMAALINILHPPDQIKEDIIEAPSHDISRIMGELMSKLTPGGCVKPSRILLESQFHLLTLVRNDLQQEADRTVETDRRFEWYKKSVWYSKDATVNLLLADPTRDASLVQSVLRVRDINTDFIGTIDISTLQNKPDAGNEITKSIDLSSMTAESSAPTRAANNETTATLKSTIKILVPSKGQGSKPSLQDKKRTVPHAAIPLTKMPSTTYASAASSLTSPKTQSTSEFPYFESARKDPKPTDKKHVASPKPQTTDRSTYPRSASSNPAPTTKLETAATIITSHQSLFPSDNIGSEDEVSENDGEVDDSFNEEIQRPLTKAEKNKAKKARAKANKVAVKTATADEDAFLAEQLAEAQARLQAEANEKARKRKLFKAKADKLRAMSSEAAQDFLAKFDTGSDRIVQQLRRFVPSVILSQPWKGYMEASKKSWSDKDRHFSFAYLALCGGYIWHMWKPENRSVLAVDSPLPFVPELTVQLLSAFSAWTGGWTAVDFFDVGPKAKDGVWENEMDAACHSIYHWLARYARLPRDAQAAEYVRKVSLSAIGSHSAAISADMDDAEAIIYQDKFWDYVGQKFPPPKYRGMRTAAASIQNDYFDILDTYRDSCGDRLGGCSKCRRRRANSLKPLRLHDFVMPFSMPIPAEFVLPAVS